MFSYLWAFGISLKSCIARLANDELHSGYLGKFDPLLKIALKFMGMESVNDSCLKKF